MKPFKKKLEKGVYLVVDPATEKQLLLEKVRLALTQPLSAVQIWDNFQAGSDIEALIKSLHALCQEHDVPLLINNQWSWLQHVPLDGVHFDQIPTDLTRIKKAIKRPFIIGLTCGNELAPIKWAEQKGIDYISFCSVFPSRTRNSCELIQLDTVKQARTLYTGSIFLSGGITPGNIHQLNTLAYDGIAIVSGIMKAERPDVSIQAYREKMKPYSYTLSK